MEEAEWRSILISPCCLTLIQENEITSEPGFDMECTNCDQKFRVPPKWNQVDMKKMRHEFDKSKHLSLREIEERIDEMSKELAEKLNREALEFEPETCPSCGKSTIRGMRPTTIIIDEIQRPNGEVEHIVSPNIPNDCEACS